jgi:hypothetical protein
MKAIGKIWNGTSLIVKILIGLVLGTLFGLLTPQATFLTILGDLFVGALKGIAPLLVFVLVISSLANASGGIGKEYGAPVGKRFDQSLYAVGLRQEQQRVDLAGIFPGFHPTGLVGIAADGVAEKGEKRAGCGFCLSGIGTADTQRYLLRSVTPHFHLAAKGRRRRQGCRGMGLVARNDGVALPAVVQCPAICDYQVAVLPLLAQYAVK